MRNTTIINVKAHTYWQAISSARWRKILWLSAFLLLLSAGVSFIGVNNGIVGWFHVQTLSGRVVSMEAQTPIQEAMLSVESIVRGSDGAFGDYVRSGTDGRFVAQIKGFPVSIGVWKPGYALNGTIINTTSLMKGQELVIELREMTKTNWVAERENREGIGTGDGFSFSSGKRVANGGLDADIILSYGAHSVNNIHISSLGAGGIIYQADSERSDFYNTPEAPAEGYVSKLSHKPDELGTYYVRTRDGKHYAKFRLKPGVKDTNKGSDFSVFWIRWAYQQDGTRNLEVEPSKMLPFPFEKFGVNRENLK